MFQPKIKKNFCSSWEAKQVNYTDRFKFSQIMHFKGLIKTNTNLTNVRAYCQQAFEIVV